MATVTAGPGFWLLATAIVGCSLGVVLLRNMVQSALCLAGMLLMVGGLYLDLQADLLAGFQVLIYVGAVVTLVLIGVMLIQNIAARYIVQTNGRWLLGAAVATGCAGMLCWALHEARWPEHGRPVDLALQTRHLCWALLDSYLLPFEVASVLLLVALVGAIVIAQQAAQNEAER